MTKEQLKHLETLSQIRDLMDRSSRFISLSGLSGVAVGSFALLGVALAYGFLGIWPFEKGPEYFAIARETHKWGMGHYTFFFVTAIFVLFFAVASGIFFTTRKARQKGYQIWDATTKRLLVNLLIPLLTGAVFCFALYYHGQIEFVAPATIVFYGLGLVNASKYTFNDIRMLGILEIILGSVALFYPKYGLEFWGFSFGILHIIYGILMYYKYEKN